jgi:hypothetical protein
MAASALFVSTIIAHYSSDHHGSTLCSRQAEASDATGDSQTLWQVADPKHGVS